MKSREGMVCVCVCGWHELLCVIYPKGCVSGKNKTPETNDELTN